MQAFDEPPEVEKQLHPISRETWIMMFQDVLAQYLDDPSCAITFRQLQWHRWQVWKRFNEDLWPDYLPEPQPY